jgi:mRNA interferase MazF
MKRREIYDARLDPTEGSEQGGIRPVVVVSRDAINANSSVILVIPCTTYRPGKRIYPTQVLLQATDGGLERDSIAMADQVRVLAKSRLLRRRGQLSSEAVDRINRALSIALDLPSDGE